MVRNVITEVVEEAQLTAALGVAPEVAEQDRVEVEHALCRARSHLRVREHDELVVILVEADRAPADGVPRSESGGTMPARSSAPNTGSLRSAFGVLKSPTSMRLGS